MYTITRNTIIFCFYLSNKRKLLIFPTIAFILKTNKYFLVNSIQIVKFEQHSTIIEDLLSKDSTIEDSIEDLNSKDATIEDSVEVMKVNLEDVIENKIGLIDVKFTELESNVTELESNVSTIIDTKIGEFDVKIDTLETDISTLIDTKLVEIEDDIVSSSFFFFKTEHDFFLIDLKS